MKPVAWAALGLLALIVTLALGWLGLSDDRPQAAEATLRAGQKEEAASTAGSLVAPTETRVESDSRMEVSAGEQADAVDVELLGEAGDGTLSVIVRGSVRARVPDLGLARVRVNRLGVQGFDERDFAHGSVERDGSFEVDATSLLIHNGAISQPERLELTVEHPRCLTSVSSVGVKKYERSTVPGRTWSPVVPEELLRGEGRLVYELDVELQSCARVYGHVEGEVTRRSDFHGLWVVALRLDEEGRPHSMREDDFSSLMVLDGASHDRVKERGRTDRQGAYELKLPPGARYAIVALEQRCRPSTSFVDVPAIGEYRVNPMLEDGISVEGGLRVLTDPAPAWIGIWFTPVDPPGGVIDVELGLDRLVFLDGRFDWARRLVRTGEGGVFSANGLGPHEYDMQVLAQGIPGVSTRGFEAGRVRAPATGVELGPFLTEVDLRFDSGREQEVAFSLCGVAEEECPSGAYRSEKDGRASLWLPPDQEYEVEVDERRLGRVRTGALGERVEWVLRP